MRNVWRFCVGLIGTGITKNRTNRPKCPTIWTFRTIMPMGGGARQAKLERRESRWQEMLECFWQRTYLVLMSQKLGQYNRNVRSGEQLVLPRRRPKDKRQGSGAKATQIKLSRFTKDVRSPRPLPGRAGNRNQSAPSGQRAFMLIYRSKLAYASSASSCMGRAASIGFHFRRSGFLRSSSVFVNANSLSPAFQ